MEKMKHNLQPKRNKCKILKTKDNLEDYGRIQRGTTYSLDRISTMKSWKAKTNKGIKRDRKSRSNVIKVS